MSPPFLNGRVIYLRKEFIRKQAIKLRKTCKSYARIQGFLERKYHVLVSRKTLKRWWKKYQDGWNLKDKSRKPHRLRPSIPKEIEDQVIGLCKELVIAITRFALSLNRKTYLSQGLPLRE